MKDRKPETVGDGIFIGLLLGVVLMLLFYAVLGCAVHEKPVPVGEATVIKFGDPLPEEYSTPIPTRKFSHPINPVREPNYEKDLRMMFPDGHYDYVPEGVSIGVHEVVPEVVPEVYDDESKQIYNK